MFYETPPAIAALEDGIGSVQCETQCMPHKGQYELEKEPKPFTAKRKHENGLMRWAKVKSSTNSLYGPGCSLRVHMCFRDPCRADYADTKYGPYGPPVHMQCITCMGPKAAPLLPSTAAPISDPSSITAAVAVSAPSTATAVAAQTPAAAAGAAKRAKFASSPLPSAKRARDGMEVEAYAPEAATSTGASVFSVAEVNSEPAIAAAAQTTGAAQTAVTMDEDESGGGDDIEDDSETSEEYQRPGETFADAERRRNFPPGAPTIRWPLTDFPHGQLIVRRERK